MMTQSSIRRLDATTATYNEFAEIMLANEPAILQDFAWLLPSFATWQSEGHANVDLLRREFGDMTVPVVECSSEGYGEQRRTSMSLSEYLDAIGEGRPASVATTVTEKGAPVGEQANVEKLLYLKDWHFQRARKDHGEDDSLAVETPFFFADDWLNWWCDEQRKDDYRFVYIGPPGSWTPLHHDVLNSHSWSFNVCGRKHWTLFAPEVTPHLYDRHGRNLATDVRKGRADSTTFPLLNEAPRIEVHQGPGEAIFVPSGWHHQVVNTGDEMTISVNTNWFNGFNLARVHSFLLSELHAVREALDHLRQDMSCSCRGGGGDCNGGGDCAGGGREWERQCEVIMRANSALNITEFARMVVARAQFLLLGDSNGGGDIAPKNCTPSTVGENKRDDDRWRLVALEQARNVLQDLAAEPFVSHLFLNENQEEEQGVDSSGGALCGGSCGSSPIPPGEGDGHRSSVDILLEVLAAIESVLHHEGSIGSAREGGAAGDDDNRLRKVAVSTP